MSWWLNRLGIMLMYYWRNNVLILLHLMLTNCVSCHSQHYCIPWSYLVHSGCLSNPSHHFLIYWPKTIKLTFVASPLSTHHCVFFRTLQLTHCIVSSSIYNGFWLPLWYLQTFHRMLDYVSCWFIIEEITL